MNLFIVVVLEDREKREKHYALLTYSDVRKDENARIRQEGVVIPLTSTSIRKATYMLATITPFLQR